MEKRLALAYEKTLALVAGSPVSVTVTGGNDETYSHICHIDPGLPALVYVANRKKEGGQWLFALALRDITNQLGASLWLRRFEIEPALRRKGQPTTYRFMGAESVYPTKEQTVVVRFRTTAEHHIAFELSPHTRKPLDAWEEAAKAIKEARTL